MIIVNADDFGRSNSINKAVVKCFHHGYISQTTIMANMPAYDDGVKLSVDNAFFDKIGLHITLDEGEPLTLSMKNNPHFCKNGLFVQGCIHGWKKFYMNSYDCKCLEEEIEAQMKKYIDTGFPLLHFDSHHHVHTNLPVMRIVTKIGIKYGFKTARICAFHPSDNLFKRLYKRVINRYIRLNFRTTDRFVVNKAKVDFHDYIEIMTHPDIIEGELVNVIKRNPLRISKFD